MADPQGEIPDTYEPSSIQVNRGRERGLGFGQKDLDYQRDPTGAVPAERWVNSQPYPRVRPPDALPPELDPPPRGFAVQEQEMPQKTSRPTKKTAPVVSTRDDPQGFAEPHSYVAPDPRAASLAPPAAREVGEVVDDLREDFLGDEDSIDDAYGEVQMGGDRRLVSGKDAALNMQGPKTLHANKERLRPLGGRP